jgi:hypothetical protein
MTLARVVIDCRSRFWEHGQLYVALSRVTDPRNICVLLPPDLDDFSIRPSVDAKVVDLLESLGAPVERVVPPEITPEDLEDPTFSEPEGVLCVPDFDDTEEMDDVPPPPDWQETPEQSREEPQMSPALRKLLVVL